MCTGYFVFSMLIHEIDFSHFKPSCGRSGNYAQDKGIFSCDKGQNSCTRKIESRNVCS